MSGRWTKLVVSLAILALGGLGVMLIVWTRPAVRSQPPPVRVPSVRVQTIEPGAFDFVVRTNGTVAPRREGQLVPQVAGPVVWVSPVFTSGGTFEEGEPLLRIDPADYRVALESARAAVARAESEHERAAAELERQQKLTAGSVASERSLDDARNTARIASAALREAKARLEQAERDLERTQLRAPYAGRVREASVDVGQFVARGAPVGRIYAIDFAEVRLPLPDSELAYLDLPLPFRGEDPSEGPEVLLRARFAGREHVWRGRIVRTEGEIDARSRMVNAVAQVSDPYGRDGANERGADGGEAEAPRPPLAVGLFVEAEIRGRHVERAVVLPRTALQREASVLVVDETSRIRHREVVVLRLEGEHAVIGSGLTRGERVVVSPLREVVEGMSVRVLEGSAVGRGGEPRSSALGASAPVPFARARARERESAS